MQMPSELKAWLILVYFYKTDMVSPSLNLNIFIIRVNVLKLNRNIFRHRWKKKNVIGSLKMCVCGEGTRSTRACVSLQTKLERSRKEHVLISRFTWHCGGTS